jgi:hypothetical protein
MNWAKSSSSHGTIPRQWRIWQDGQFIDCLVGSSSKTRRSKKKVHTRKESWSTNHSTRWTFTSHIPDPVRWKIAPNLCIAEKGSFWIYELFENKRLTIGWISWTIDRMRLFLLFSSYTFQIFPIYNTRVDGKYREHSQSDCIFFFFFALCFLYDAAFVTGKFCCLESPLP